MITALKRMKNMVAGIFVLMLCTIIGISSKKAMYDFSRFILCGWAVWAVLRTVQWVAADSRHGEKASRKEMNTIFLGALFPMITLVAGYSATVGAAASKVDTVSDVIEYKHVSSVGFAVSFLLPVIVLVACLIVVNFGSGIKAKTLKRGAAKDKQEKDRQRVQNKINKANDKAIVSMATADARIATAKTEAAVKVASAQGKRISMLATKSAVESATAIPGAVVGGIAGGVKDGLTADTAELHQLAQQLNSGTQGVGELPAREVPQIEVKEV